MLCRTPKGPAGYPGRGTCPEPRYREAARFYRPKGRWIVVRKEWNTCVTGRIPRFHAGLPAIRMVHFFVTEGPKFWTLNPSSIVI